MVYNRLQTVAIFFEIFFALCCLLKELGKVLKLCVKWPGFFLRYINVFMSRKHLEEVMAFMREHRSNESNFELLRQKLEEEINGHVEDAMYKNDLQEVKEKYAEEYRTAKEQGGTAWPEFEKFVSEFEKTLAAALKKEA